MGTDNAAIIETLDYYRAKQCSNQWRAFLNAFTAELFSHADGEDARGFMTQLGRRMAGQLVLGECEALEDLEAAMNRHWADLDWGWCRLTETDRAVVIRHAAWPVPDRSDTHWTNAMGALLEGVYSGWFEAQGGDAHLRAKQHADAGSEAAGVLEFRYAN